MNEKTKIKLTPEQETLLIPLFTKAQPGNPLFFDPKAQEILNQVDYDFTRLRVPYKTVILVCQRAKKLDAMTSAFLAEHPNSVLGYKYPSLGYNHYPPEDCCDWGILIL